MPSPLRLLRTTTAAAHRSAGWLAYRCGWLATARRRFERVLLLRGADFGAYVHLGRIAFDLGDYAGWRREFEHARRTDPIRFARLRHPIGHPMELFEPRLCGTGFDAGVYGNGDLDGFDSTEGRATWRSLRGGSFGGGAFGGSSFGGPLGDGLQDGGDRPRSDEGSLRQALRDGAAPDGADQIHDGFGHGTDMPLAPDFDPIKHDDQRGTTDDVRHGPRRDAQLPDASLSRDDFGSPAERRRFQLRRPIDSQEIARCDLNDLARRLTS